MSFRLFAAGIGEASITATHTSFAAERAPARLPAAALLQMPWTLLFTLAASAGSRATINLQIATYCFTTAASAGLTGSACMAVVAVVAGLPGAAVEVVAGVPVAGAVAVVPGLAAATVAVVAGALVAVEPLVVELPLPPQAASSAAHSTATTGSDGRLPIIDFPLVCENTRPSLVEPMGKHARHED
jgi:hypothetical protein